MSDKKQKQARLTKEQADAIQVKYKEWEGSLKSRARQVLALASSLGLTVSDEHMKGLIVSFIYYRSISGCAPQDGLTDGLTADTSWT